MENAAEALKMAGAVMLFVLALSIILFSFGQARQSADTILDYRDRETAYIGNYYQMEGTEREVGLETVIPTIFRAYLENYKVVFDGLDYPIYNIRYMNSYLSKFTLDAETGNIDVETGEVVRYDNASVGGNEDKKEFLKGILNHEYTGISEQDFARKYRISFDGCPETLYEQLEGKRIVEYLGVYYQNPDMASEANRTEKRVITYKITNR